jgi:hypothetical protein
MVDNRKKLLDNIINDIKTKYQSLEKPNFTFVSKIVDRNPYREFIEGLKAYCEIEDITDINYDVSFVYIVNCSNQQYMLQLSMVGRYAALYRLSSKREMLIIDPKEVVVEPIVKTIINALEKEDIALLDEQMLDSELNIKININDEKMTSSLDECLFTNKG